MVEIKNVLNAFLLTNLASLSLSVIHNNDAPLVDRYVLQVEDGDINEIIKKAEEFGYFPKRRILDNYYMFEKQLPGVEHVTDSRENIIMSEFEHNPKVRSIRQEKLLKRVRKCDPVDTEWNNMWFLNGDSDPNMNVDKVWEMGVTGKGVVVAIVDDGVESIHPDLKNNMDTEHGYDFLDEDSDPSPSYRASEYFSHGTNCAGLVAAERDNDVCIVGVAYEAKIVGIRLIGGYVTDSTEAAALTHALSTIDIYSNSWGPADGVAIDGPLELTTEALAYAILNGRGGKGSIYVWAAGNGGIEDNCNTDGYANSIYTIASSSLGHDGKPAFYAEVCAATLAVTYGGGGGDYLTSLDAESKCSSRVLQGTSYSTPVAAGIIALVLEANSMLTWRDVQHLIVLTSDRNGTDDDIYGWTQNGAGFYVSQRLGFGLMNAEDLVRKAFYWETVPEPISCLTSVNVEDNINYYVASISSVHVHDCGINFIEHVQVRLVFETSSVGAVQIVLSSPSGTESYLLSHSSIRQKIDSSSYWDFMSVHFWGENPSGDWTLMVDLRDEFATGSVLSWNLTMYGTATYPYSDCHCLEDEYACSDCECISSQQRCDGVADCSNSDDEENCECSCSKEEFDCGGCECIYPYWVCDGESDCSNSADEENCVCDCEPGQFTCRDCSCVDADFECDWYLDCPDYSDEMFCDCGEPIAPVTMDLVVGSTVLGSSANYTCKDGFVPSGNGSITCEFFSHWSCLSLRCTAVDCEYPLEEENMMLTLTGSTFGNIGEYTCHAGFSSKGNGTISCQETGQWSASSLECIDCNCGVDEYACGDCECIPNVKHCNMEIDCSDGADEDDCGCDCSADTFACGDCMCIPDSWECDGYNDCDDATDEVECVCECDHDEFECGSCDCIPSSWACDGFKDCGDKSDEEGCDCDCDDDEFACADCMCIPAKWACDGWPDCFDDTDEVNCSCECSGDQFQCDSCSCIPTQWECDGTSDCLDSMDEENCDSDCGPPDDVEHATTLVTSTTFGSIVRYECDIGYMPVGDGSVICEEKWSPLNFQCQVVDCGPPAEVDKTHVLVSDTTYGRNATYMCLTGFGTGSIKCEANGNWSCLVLICIGGSSSFECGDPDILPHAISIVLERGVGSKAYYECDAGYTLVGNGEVICEGDGQWSDVSCVCKSTGALITGSIVLVFFTLICVIMLK